MTLKDVAVISGCSIATVSKVFKDSAEISDVTKQSVLKAAKECGYLKKATGKPVTLGGIKTVIISDVDGAILDRISDIILLFKKKGFVTLYTRINEKNAIELMEQIGASGVAVCGKCSSKAENIMEISDDLSLVTVFALKLDEIHPVRASRSKSDSGAKSAGDSKTKVKRTNKKSINLPLKKEVKNEVINKEKPEASSPKEEIWLL